MEVDQNVNMGQKKDMVAKKAKLSMGTLFPNHGELQLHFNLYWS